jgi:hypothetical protein
MVIYIYLEARAAPYIAVSSISFALQIIRGSTCAFRTSRDNAAAPATYKMFSREVGLLDLLETGLVETGTKLPVLVEQWLYLIFTSPFHKCFCRVIRCDLR